MNPRAARDAIDQLMNVLEKQAERHGWSFRRTRDGYELDRNVNRQGAKSAKAAEGVPF